MQIRAPKRTTTTGQAYEAVLDAVLDGSIAPGTHLTLQSLADQLGTSLQPVREAIRQLEAIGMLEVEAHRGARVPLLTASDFEDTYRARLNIEGLLVELAALNFTSDDAAAAHAALADQHAAVERGDRAAARAAHQAFHFAIYGAARSPWLFRSMLPTWHNAERYRLHSTVTATSVARRGREHRDLLRACEAHDASRAKVALEHHLLESVRRSARLP